MGAASFRRLLGGAENPPADGGGKLDERKEAFGIEIVLTGLIDHPELPMLRSVPIGDDLVQLAALQGSLIAPIAQAQDELTRSSGHISQDNV